MESTNSSLIVNKSYHEEGPYYHEAWSQPAIMQQLKMSTYINTLIDHGFRIERMIEDTCSSEVDLRKHSNSWYSYEKAKSIPTTFIIKSVKDK